MFAPAGTYAIARAGTGGGLETAGTESCRRFLVSTDYEGTLRVHENPPGGRA